MDPPPYSQPAMMAPIASEKSQLDPIQPGVISTSGQGFVLIQPPQVGYVNGGPSIFYASRPTPVVYKDFKARQSKFLGIAQIIIGIICITLIIVSQNDNPFHFVMDYPFTPFGILIGMFFIITGAFGISGGTMKKRGFIIVFMVLCIVSLVGVAVMLFQSSVSLYIITENECYYNESHDYHGYEDDIRYPGEIPSEGHLEEYMYPDGVRPVHIDDYRYDLEMPNERHPDDFIYPSNRRPVMHPPDEIHPDDYVHPDDIIPDEFWPFDVTTARDTQYDHMPYDDEFPEISSDEPAVDESPETYSGETYYNTNVTTQIPDDEDTVELTTAGTTTQIIITGRHRYIYHSGREELGWYEEILDDDPLNGNSYDDTHYGEIPSYDYETTPGEIYDNIGLPSAREYWDVVQSDDIPSMNEEEYRYWQCPDGHERRLVIHSLLLDISLLEGILSIWGSIIGCKEICCCRASTPEKIKIHPNFNSIIGKQKAFIFTVPNIASYSAKNGFADTKVQAYEFTNSVALNSEDINSNMKEKINLGFEYGAE